MFKVNDWVIYPGQGVCSIKEKAIVSGKSFFKSKLSSGATIMFPDSTESGDVVRTPCSKSEVKTALRIMKTNLSGDLPKRLPALEKILINKFASGSVFEIAEMVKMIWQFKKARRLSVSEVRLLDQGIKHLIEEFSIVLKWSEERTKLILMKTLS